MTDSFKCNSNFGMVYFWSPCLWHLFNVCVFVPLIKSQANLHSLHITTLLFQNSLVTLIADYNECKNWCRVTATVDTVLFFFLLSVIMFFSPCLPHIEIIKILLKWKLCGVQRCVFSWIGLQNWVTEVLYTQTAIHRGLDLLFKLVITFNKSSFVVFLWALSPVGGIIDIGINKNQGSLGLLRLSKDQKTLSLRINITLIRVQIERPYIGT